MKSKKNFSHNNPIPESRKESSLDDSTNAEQKNSNDNTIMRRETNEGNRNMENADEKSKDDNAPHLSLLPQKMPI